MELKELIRQQKAKGVPVKALAHSPLVIMAQDCGMGFILYDYKHDVLSYEQLHDLMVLGNMRELSSIVRVAQLAKSDVSRILDCGACGMMVPMIGTAEQAKWPVQWSKCPSLGKRSYSGGANTHYVPGGNHALHMEQLNEKTMSIVQIEIRQGVENIDAILNVKGIDGVLIGPCDLAIPLGQPDNLMREEELSMIQEIADTCLKYDLGFGIIGDIAMQEYFKKESSLLVSAIDTALTWEGLKQVVREYEQLERRQLYGSRKRTDMGVSGYRIQ